MGEQLKAEFSAGRSVAGSNSRALPHRGGSQLHSQVAFLANGDTKVRLFNGLERAERHAVLTAGSYRYFSHDTVVTHQGDPADRLYLLLRGSARFFFLDPDGRKVYLHWLAAGEIFGAASLLSEAANCIVSTEVAKNTHALSWHKNVLRSLVRVYPRLLENALSIACDYLGWYVATHLSLVSYSASERLAYVLLGLAEGIGEETSEGKRINITNEQLANTSNITLFTASRLLAEFQRRGVISKGRGSVVIRNPERLFEVARRDEPKPK